jgi:hypothetical protein
VGANPFCVANQHGKRDLGAQSIRRGGQSHFIICQDNSHAPGASFTRPFPQFREGANDFRRLQSN